jgi:protease-4
MSSEQPPYPPPGRPIPPPGYPPRYPPPPPPRGGSPLLGCAFAVSLLVNVLGGLLVVLLCVGVLFRGASVNPDGSSTTPLGEHHLLGKAGARNKVAVVHLDGVIMEGMLGFVHKQIDQAARDKDVKAVVLRVNSPGGSITASDDLHRRLTELVRGNADKKADPKPLLVSMGSMAASGGYYVAMPAQTLFAERTTVTGSIGVYASFPNVSGLAEKWQVSMNVIKQGEIKDSGSPFRKMSDEEREVWQDMVNHAYNQFIDVVAQGRPGLKKADLVTRFPFQPVAAGPQDGHNGEAPKEGRPRKETRYRADGGIFTADEALKLNLIDKIGYLEDAIQEARDVAQVGDDYRVFEYERPRSLGDLLFGGGSGRESAALLEPERLARGLTPRLWYLAPGCELAGALQATAAPK